jgi:hypothetical protein
VVRGSYATWWKSPATGRPSASYALARADDVPTSTAMTIAAVL